MVEYLSLLKSKTKIDCERVILRPFTVDDAADFFDICSNPKVTEFLTWEPHKNIEETIDRLNNSFIGNPLFFAIELKSENKCIGCIDIRVDAEHDKAGFGFMLHPNYWSNGYMSEVLCSILVLLFNGLKLNRVESTHYVGNEGSGRVMAKCGMLYEGTSLEALKIKGKYVDVVQYGLLRKSRI